MLVMVGTITLLRCYFNILHDWLERTLPSQTFHKDGDLNGDVRKFNIPEPCLIWGYRTVVTRVSPIIINRRKDLESAENDQESRTKGKTGENRGDCQVCKTDI